MRPKNELQIKPANLTDKCNLSIKSFVFLQLHPHLESKTRLSSLGKTAVVFLTYNAPKKYLRRNASLFTICLCCRKITEKWVWCKKHLKLSDNVRFVFDVLAMCEKKRAAEVDKPVERLYVF